MPDTDDATSSNPLSTMALCVLAAVALGLALYFMSPVLVPLVLAIFVSYLVLPVVDLLQLRLKIPRALAVLAALLLAAGILFLLVVLISYSMTSLADKAPVYQAKLQDIGQRFIATLQDWGLPVDADTVRSKLNEIPVASILGGFLNSFVSILSTFLLVLIFAIYLVMGRQPYEKKEGVYQEIDAKIRQYIGVKVAVSAVTGILVALLLAIVGLDLAPVFGVLAFLLNFIPSIGSVLATFLPLPLALVQFESAGLILVAVLLPGTVQMVIGNVIEPRLLGASLNLHPITILLSLIFWGMLWGMAGMVLAAPITAVVKIILDRIESTRPAGALLGGKLPGT